MRDERSFLTLAAEIRQELSSLYDGVCARPSPQAKPAVERERELDYADSELRSRPSAAIQAGTAGSSVCIRSQIAGLLATY